MSTIQDMFQQAQLSEAAYATFVNGGGLIATGDELKTALINEGMSTDQASAFVAQWTVLDQHTDPTWPVGNGFSATVFQNSQTHQIYLAIRGTEPSTPADLLAAINLATGSLARGQIISMVNYVLRLQAGSAYSAYQLIDSGSNVVLSPTMATGIGLGNVNFNNVTVAGHSLGGYLGEAFGRLFGGSLCQLYTYNAPGFYGDLSLFNQITNLLGSPAGTFATATGINLVVPGDWVHDVGMVPGLQTQTPMFSEGDSASTPIDAHSIKKMTDSLAVYNLFAAIDPSLSLDAITGILKAESSVAANTLESTITALGKLFGATGTTFTSNEFDANRDLLYKALNGINAAAICYSGPFTIRNLTVLTDTQIASNAHDNIAYRYALVNANPFAVTGMEYSSFNQNGELDLYGTKGVSIALLLEQPCRAAHALN